MRRAGGGRHSWSARCRLVIRLQTRGSVSYPGTSRVSALGWGCRTCRCGSLPELPPCGCARSREGMGHTQMREVTAWWPRQFSTGRPGKTGWTVGDRRLSAASCPIGCWSVTAIGLMRLRPGQCGIEYADEPEFTLGRADHVRVVLVQRINRSGPDGEYLSGREVFHLALAADAIVRLEVMFVVETLLGSWGNDRVAQGATHSVSAYNEPAASPSGTIDILFGAADVIESSNNHRLVSLISIRSGRVPDRRLSGP